MAEREHVRLRAAGLAFGDDLHHSNCRGNGIQLAYVAG